MTLNQIWLRILDAFLSGMAYTLFACILLYARSKRGTGHHRGLLYTALFCLAQATANVTTAWDLYHGGYRLIVWVQTPVALLKMSYVIYVWAFLSDLIITLRRSEFGNRLYLDALADRAQERLNLDYVTETSKSRITQTLEFITRRSKEHDHSDSAVGQCGR